MSEPDTVNGIRVTDVDSLYEAVSYLQEDYNDGDVSVYDGNGDGLITHVGITGRGNYVENHVVRAVENAPNCTFTTIKVRGGDPYVEVKDPRFELVG